MAEAREFRYSRQARWRDVAVAMMSGGIPAAILWAVLRRRFGDEINLWHLLAAWTFLAMPVAWVLGRWRWGSWVRVDELAISCGREARGPVESVAWSDVSSVAIREAWTALYGDGRWLKVAGDVEDLAGLRREILSRVGPFVLPRFEADIAAGRPALFRGGEKQARVVAEGVVGMAGVLFLSGSVVAGSVALRAQDPWAAGRAAILAAVAGTALLTALGFHLRGSGWRFGGVGVAKDGLTIKGWGKPRSIPWAEVEGADFDGRGRLVLRLRSGPPIRIPTFLGDFLFLAPLIRDRLG